MSTIAAGTPARADVIGVAAPLSGSSSLLGQQLRNGAEAAAKAMTDRPITLEVQDDLCTAEGGATAARHFVEMKADFVIGFLCTDAINAAMPFLSQAGIPVVTPGVRTNSLTDNREKTGWPIYRIAPRDDAEEQAVAGLLLPLWRDTLFAIVDDGTIYGRNLAESFRSAAEATGLKPTFVDTFRPQLENQIGLVGRLKRAGATHVFVGGDREDVAIMGRDAQQLDYDLTLAGGEALRAATVNTLPAVGTLMIAPPDWSTEATTETLLQLRTAGIEPEGYVMPGYAAVEIAAKAIADAAAKGKSARSILDTEDFSTAIGTIRFNEQGDLAANPYRLYRFDGSQFVGLDP
ncbi:branched-chain amino acid ABC transporter substrate-binding protein [Tianweitania sp. BSSL-BM11]|uniref:Branched-chain amino acid ABC transporter substrate-binding protein n=1 Tax=Tianweitania aestuarii TaxID=2814886 RepID=A0ABS5RTE0_9HYPH|nr:branched-chain amino acid ABC transporter substrate-binding protein [Tianweitania aestuarii]